MTEEQFLRTIRDAFVEYYGITVMVIDHVQTQTGNKEYTKMQFAFNDRHRLFHEQKFEISKAFDLNLVHELFTIREEL